MDDKKPETLGEMSRSPWSGRGTLGQLVDELKRQAASKVDFVADTRGLRVDPVAAVPEVKEGKKVVQPGTPGSLRLAPNDLRTGEWLPKAGLGIRPNAVEQLGLAQQPGIPGGFLKDLAALRPNRAADLLNGLMQDGPTRRFIRCLDGNVRAALSDRYRVLDSLDIAFPTLEAARAAGAEVLEANLSETHMRLKLISRNVWDAIELRRQQGGGWYAGGLGNQDYLRHVSAKSEGDLPGGPGTVYPVVTVSNSETGHGGFNVRIGIMMGICFNLATVEDVVARVHLGERLEQGIFTAQTMNLEAQAILGKARDAVRAAFNKDSFARIVAAARKAQQDTVQAPTGAVENVVKAAGLSENAKDAILAHFLRDYDPSRFGLAQAVSRHAQDTQDPNVADTLENLAGDLIRGGNKVTHAAMAATAKA